MAARLALRAPLGETEIQAVLGLDHQVVEYAAGRYLVREGQRHPLCHVLLEGFANRHKIVAGGARQIVGIHLPGDILELQGPMLGVSGENVQATTGLKAAAIALDSISQAMSRYPALANALLKEALISSAISSEWIANVGRRDSRTRTAHILCELSVRQKAAGLASNGQFEMPMTQEQLGDALGLTPVHVNRTLKILVEDGLIRRNRRRVTIADWQALMRAGDFRPAYLHLDSAA